MQLFLILGVQQMSAFDALHMPLASVQGIERNVHAQESVCGLPNWARANGSLVELVLLHQPCRVEPVCPQQCLHCGCGLKVLLLLSVGSLLFLAYFGVD